MELTKKDHSKSKTPRTDALTVPWAQSGIAMGYAYAELARLAREMELELAALRGLGGTTQEPVAMLTGESRWAVLQCVEIVRKHFDHAPNGLEEKLVSFLATIPAGTVAVPRELVDFLLGIRDLDGVGFGEFHPTIKGRFWWRHRLAACFAAAPEAGSEEGTR